MYTTLRVDVQTTVSTIDEFKSMIVVNLTVKLGNGSTLVVDGELILSTIDDFGNIVDGIVTFEDTSRPINLVDDVEIFSTIDEFSKTVIDTTLVVEENWLSTLLVNEEPTVAIIYVSSTGTIIGATLSVEDIDGSRLLESEDDVIYSITKIWNKDIELIVIWS